MRGRLALLPCVGVLLAGMRLAAAAETTNTLPIGPAAAAGTTNPVLSRLEAALANVKTVRTRFVQEKQLSLFKHTLVTRGVIQIEMPGKLLWRVASPIRYALLIDGEQARQWDGETGQTQRLPLGSNPVFAAVTEQLQAWFGGRYHQLARDYAIVQRSESPLVFAFTPNPETPPAKMLKGVTVTFREDRRYIAALQIDETSGDSTAIRFEETEIDVPLAPKDWELK